LTGENIDEFEKFLSIHQHFPYQNFPLIIFCHLPAGSLLAQGVIIIVYQRTHVKFFPVQICIAITIAQWKNSGQWLCAHSKQISKVTP